ncbi:hypothetical protein [Nocardioides salsibiostraticola]
MPKSESTLVTARRDLLGGLNERVLHIGASRLPLRGLAVLVSAGVIALVVATGGFGPDWLGRVGSVLIATTFSWALAARTGGRPVVFGSLALALGLIVLISDADRLRTGAAVMTCVVSAVLAVMTTVPAVRAIGAVRECAIAVAIAGVGALATVGFEPTITVARFEYATFALSLMGAFAVVYRLGAGLHGLGRRGAAIVVVGGVMLAVTLAYAELLRRYGTPGLVSSLEDVVTMSRDTFGAFPRPIVAVLGIPALAWGCHMRARRRQGWWLCAFGVAGTSAVANSLANPSVSVTEGFLSILYGLVVGLALGYALIRLDLALTGPKGRRSIAAEEATAVRPEPRRHEALL